MVHRCSKRVKFCYFVPIIGTQMSKKCGLGFIWLLVIHESAVCSFRIKGLSSDGEQKYIQIYLECRPIYTGSCLRFRSVMQFGSARKPSLLA